MSASAFVAIYVLLIVPIGLGAVVYGLWVLYEHDQWRKRKADEELLRILKGGHTR